MQPIKNNNNVFTHSQMIDLDMPYVVYNRTKTFTCCRTSNPYAVSYCMSVTTLTQFL
jgi:hypothetical protein